MAGAVVCFGFGWQLYGLWTGLTLGNAAAVALLLSRFRRIDWVAQVRPARAIGQRRQAPSSNSPHASGIKARWPDGGPGPDRARGSARQEQARAR